MRSAVASLALMLSQTGLQMADDSKLDQLRNEVRTSSPGSSGGSSSSNSNRPDYADDDLGGFLGVLFYYTVISPFTIPYHALSDDYYSPSRFVAYPYAHDWPGSLQPSGAPDNPEQGIPAEWDRLWTFRLGLEEGNDFHGINRVGAAYLFDTFTRFGLGGRVDFFNERVSEHCADQLMMSDVNLLFRFAHSERVQFRFGVGARLLHDRQQTDAGFNIVYGVEMYPGDPWTFRVQLEGGNVGQAGVFRVNTALGAAWKRLEAQIGYDYLQVGNVQLQGPFVGLRVWF